MLSVLRVVPLAVVVVALSILALPGCSGPEAAVLDVTYYYLPG